MPRLSERRGSGRACWILAVAHALEDLTSHRIFRNAFPLQQALDEIRAHRGSQYDPDVVDACLRAFNKEE